MHKDKSQGPNTARYVRLLLEKMDGKFISLHHFLKLAALYAEATGIQVKAARHAKEAKVNASKPVLTKDMEQILEIETKRNSNGTR